MVEMQTITAEVLQMDRGVSSDKQHLTAQQYKSFAEEARIKAAGGREGKERKADERRVGAFQGVQGTQGSSHRDRKNASEGVKGSFRAEFQG